MSTYMTAVCFRQVPTGALQHVNFVLTVKTGGCAYIYIQKEVNAEELPTFSEEKSG